ncbi:hypothetical protein [Lysobacter sp. M2-1]|uniref:XAC0095 family protein n=1 Tax=Lysobacter sp. M2-1 TaxID=2916839 RepID=UPI001F594695|nr:hypothetical protein [Lysobacter sp. M2-1]
MSKGESSDPGVPGYFLPEDSQLRLAKLSDHIRFLARLAQPRTYKEQELAPEVPVGELAVCLELLAEQADLVLQEMSWFAPRQIVTGAGERSAVSGAAPEVSDTADARFAFGVTLDQIDALDRLIQAISAHGDVVAAGHTAELAGGTLPLLGQAIYDAAVTLRAILDQVEAQRLGEGARLRTGVGEERGAYCAGLASLAMDGLRSSVLQMPAHRPPDHARQSSRVRLHRSA